MRRTLPQWLAMALACLALAACDRVDRPRTSPVMGRVSVNHQPAADLAVIAHDVQGLERGLPAISTACTDRDGTFSLSSGVSRDGLPEGQYVLTFLWGQRNPTTTAYSGPDKLHNRYADPRTTPIRLSVEAGQPTNLGQIELSVQ